MLLHLYFTEQKHFKHAATKMSVPAHVTMLDFIATPGYKQPFFGCHEDPVTCVATYCCSCIVVGVAVGRLYKTEFDLVACLCSGIGAYRLRRA